MKSRASRTIPLRLRGTKKVLESAESTVRLATQLSISPDSLRTTKTVGPQGQPQCAAIQWLAGVRRHAQERRADPTRPLPTRRCMVQRSRRTTLGPHR
jgi:hypothetical protein